MTKTKKSVKKNGFRVGEHVVYPTHGVGKITAVETEIILDTAHELFVISFEHDKMLLRVPVDKVEKVGVRRICEGEMLTKALDKLNGRARIKRTMWSRRAQEYESKINSGALVSIAEVVRDLFRSENQPEQSYSERQLYEVALERMARELAVAEKLTDAEATVKIEDMLSASPHRGAKAKKVRSDEESASSTGESVAKDEPAQAKKKPMAAA